MSGVVGFPARSYTSAAILGAVFWPSSAAPASVSAPVSTLKPRLTRPSSERGIALVVFMRGVWPAGWRGEGDVSVGERQIFTIVVVSSCAETGGRSERIWKMRFHPPGDHPRWGGMAEWSE